VDDAVASRNPLPMRRRVVATFEDVGIDCYESPILIDRKQHNDFWRYGAPCGAGGTKRVARNWYCATQPGSNCGMGGHLLEFPHLGLCRSAKSENRANYRRGTQIHQPFCES